MLANKLVLAGFTVLVIERGPGGDIQESDVPILNANIPGNFLKTLDTELNWRFEIAPQKGLNGRSLKGHRGTGLGGSSRVNFMAWVRGPKADFDDWADLVGDESWKWEKVLGDMKSVCKYCG